MNKNLKRLGMWALCVTLLAVGFSLPTFRDAMADTPLEVANKFRNDSLSKPLPKSWLQRSILDTEHSGQYVALTFDDGPNPIYTPQILDILRQYHIHATFCIVGEMARAYPDLVKQIVAEGHRICDHSMTHDENLPYHGDAKMRAEILGTRDVLNKLVPGTPVYYFRPPGGNINNHEIDLVEGWGMKALYWSVDTRDWARKGVNAIMIQVRTELDPGGVILMHDGGGDRSQTVQALRILIPQLIGKGYQFDFPRH